MEGKIALEEHVTFPGFEDLTPVGAIPPELYESHRAALRDLDGPRRDELEATGVATVVLSLTAPGIQAVADPAVALRRAREANDALAGMLAGREGRCFHTPALRNVLDEVGADRILYSVDSPYESPREAATWFDNTPLPPTTRHQIAHTNAARLLGLP
jgi:hypothetical protein